VERRENAMKGFYGRILFIDLTNQSQEVEEELEPMLDEYCELRSWDREGWPKAI
jgi:aldehyde:ferredoxin oxidoreductase